MNISSNGELRFRRHHLVPSIPAGRTALMILGIAVLAVVVSIVVLVSTFTSDKTVAPVPVAGPVDVGDAYQAARSSDGRNGAPLALVKGAPMFPLPASGSLRSYDGAPVEAQGIRVQSVAANGVWIGDAPDQRVWVSIPLDITNRDKISAGSLKSGDAINVSGRFAVLSSDPQTMGFTLPGDADTLDRQGEMLVANGMHMASSDGTGG